MLSSGIHKRWTALFGLVAGLSLVGAGSPAFAHDELIGTDPADGAVVETLPASLTLTFSGVLLTGEGATQIVVTDANGTDLTAAEPAVDGVRVTQQLSGTPAGTVQVAWRVVSSDGHPISGQYAFSVGEAGSQPPSATPAPERGDAGGDLLPLWIVVGVVVAAGAVVAFVIARRRPSRED